MTIPTTDYNRCKVVRMEGRIDSSNGDELHGIFKGIISGGTENIVFDMEDVD